MGILSTICLILGCFLGAGFVSGREIACYFSKFGNISYLSCVVCGVLFFVLIMFFFSVSRTVKSAREFMSVYFQKYSWIIEWLFAICLVIFVGSMIAGTASLAGGLGYNQLFVVLVTILLTYLVVCKNIQGISKINLILVPVLILSLSLTITHGEYVPSVCNNLVTAMLSSGAYVFINIVSLAFLIIEIGHKYSYRQQLVISIVSTVIIVGLLLGINYAIISNNLISSIMPNLVLSARNKLLYLVMQISIYIGLFTTLISNTFLLSEFVCKYIHKKSLAILISLLLGGIISICGFDNIVGFVYIFIGIVGIIIVVCGVIKRNCKIEKVC